MGENSKISWTHHTFNPWIGCTKIAAGCVNCYAATQDKLRRWTPEGWGGPRKRTSESYWKQPLKWDREAKAAGERRRVFCASLADVFDDDLASAHDLSQWRSDLEDLIDKCRNLDWLLLTKRPAKAKTVLQSLYAFGEFEPWPHLWFGVSIATQKDADELLPIALEVPAAVHFISFEPLLEEINLRKAIPCGTCGGDGYGLFVGGKWTCEDCGGHEDAAGNGIARGFDMAIIGGESGPRRREMPMNAARSLIEQCDSAGLRVFVKQDSAQYPETQGRFTDAEFARKELPRQEAVS